MTWEQLGQRSEMGFLFYQIDTWGLKVGHCCRFTNLHNSSKKLIFAKKKALFMNSLVPSLVQAPGGVSTEININKNPAAMRRLGVSS